MATDALRRGLAASVVLLGLATAGAQDFPLEPPVAAPAARVPDSTKPPTAPARRDASPPTPARNSSDRTQAPAESAALVGPSAARETTTDSTPAAGGDVTAAASPAASPPGTSDGTLASGAAEVGPPATEQSSVPAGSSGRARAAPLELLGETIMPSSRQQLRWRVGESFDGTAVSTPVWVVHGARPGPHLCLTAAVHGDELNGVEVVRRVLNDVDPAQLSGTLLAVPVVNLLGFSRGTRYLPDRRDLNRYFPGSTSGSSASRIAGSLFRDVVAHCDALVDFHTGSFDRSNLPQVRGDLRIAGVLAFTRGFGATPVLHSPGSRGMLRLAATDQGIPAVTFEVGAPLRLEPEKIDFAVQALNALMHRLGMTRSFRMFAEPQATFYESRWVRVDHGGMLFATVELGDRVRVGQRLGKVIDPLLNEEHELTSPHRGRVIGLALNQVVLPGFAAFHVGIETSEQQAVEEAQQPLSSDDAIERMEGDEMGPAPPDPANERGEPDAAQPPGDPGPGRE